ncbi:Sde2 N-terminal domain-containing protein [Cokeromyces recurvatus]|uniref:Sde2 N-terminal domain-containing protein n=1 Tax=Cokeromyces recurvatus TaxID=90255 RepID=UPI00221F4D04|nr:Sde2 N-terminal domain-containing protein [Cokeromyces recurvatus]KAI7908317.1 Sde2 N-terminal domain-containing protein [Cokeromyces recurvatus]
MTQAIISLISNKQSICLPINNYNNTTTEQLKTTLETLTSIPAKDQVLRTLNGQFLLDHESIDCSHEFLFIEMSGRLLGGKGGFGSMLRAQGGRMNAQKTTNFEACRDLQGRRIRAVNEAKK